jgi:hypothetical protein
VQRVRGTIACTDTNNGTTDTYDTYFDVSDARTDADAYSMSIA